MNFAKFRTHAIPYFISSNIILISMPFFKLSAVLTRDVSNDSAPPSINDISTLSSQVHNYNTRSSSVCNFYRKYGSRLNHHKNLRKLSKHALRNKYTIY